MNKNATTHEIMTQGTLEARIEHAVDSGMLTAESLDENALAEHYLDLRELTADLIIELRAQQKEADFHKNIQRNMKEMVSTYRGDRNNREQIRTGYTASFVKTSRKTRETFSITGQDVEVVDKIDLNKNY